MSVWERFDDIAGTEEVADSKASLKPIEEGEYEAVLESIEAGESKSGLPMLKARFRTNTNQVVFYNKVLQIPTNQEMTVKNVAEAVAFVEGVLGEEIEFTGLNALAETVENIPEGGDFTIKITYGKKDNEKSFPNIEIIGEEDIPF